MTRWFQFSVNRATFFAAAEPYTVPKTVMEALEQRLKKYQETEEAAKREENPSKVRRMGRIVQQYKNAIQLHKAGKPIPVEELPTPPGKKLLCAKHATVLYIIFDILILLNYPP